MFSRLESIIRIAADIEKFNLGESKYCRYCFATAPDPEEKVDSTYHYVNK